MAGIGDLFGGLGGINWGGLFGNLIKGTIVIVVIGIIAVFGFIWMKNKMTFKIPCNVIRVMANGSHKRITGLRGGQVKGKNGIQDFVIKVPKQFKPKLLGFVPDYSLANADGELTFIVIGDGMAWQQCIEKVITEKDIEMEIEVPSADGKGMEKQKKTLNYSLMVEPIPTDIKTITINNIHAVENIMESNKLKAAAIIVGGFILMVFVQIIFLFLTSK